MVKKASLKLGTIGERTFVVSESHVIDFTDGGMPPVLSTPALIWFLEHAAREAVLSALEPGESTVGVHVEVDHLAATPLGHRVTCRAYLIQYDEKAAWFRLEAYDEQELIAHGMHQLRIVRVDRFTKRVQEKKKGK